MYLKIFVINHTEFVELRFKTLFPNLTLVERLPLQRAKQPYYLIELK